MSKIRREVVSSSRADHPASTFLARCFCAGIPIRKALDATIANYGTTAWDSEQAQQCLMIHTLIQEEKVQQRIPDFSFGAARSSRFTRLLLDEIDHCGTDVCEELVMRAAELCQTAHGSRDSTRWLILHIGGVSDVHKGEDGIVLCIGDSFSSIGLQVWEAGIWLTGCLTNSRGPTEDVRGKNVLELAAGTGVCAKSLASTAGAAHVWMTDVGDEVIKNIERNVASNGMDDRVSVAPLDVSDALHVQQRVDEWGIDTIFAADVTYDEQLAGLVINAISHSIRNTVRVAWIVATRRNEDTFNALQDLFEKAGLNVKAIDQSIRPQRPDCYAHCDWDRIEAWRLTSKRIS